MDNNILALLGRRKRVILIALLLPAPILLLANLLMTNIPFLMPKKVLENKLLALTRNGTVQQFEALLKHGADANAANEFGTTAFHLAAMYENRGIVEFLLKKGQSPADKARALAGAVANGRYGLAELLVSHDADPNLKYDGAGTPLMSAIGSTQAFQLLLDHGARIDIKDNYSRTVLIWASLHGTPRVIQILCERGADLDAQDDGGNTAFTSAEKKGRNDLLQELRNCREERVRQSNTK